MLVVRKVRLQKKENISLKINENSENNLKSSKSEITNLKTERNTLKLNQLSNTISSTKPSTSDQATITESSSTSDQATITENNSTLDQVRPQLDPEHGHSHQQKPVLY